jgi:hypothetical protein
MRMGYSLGSVSPPTWYSTSRAPSDPRRNNKRLLPFGTEPLGKKPWNACSDRPTRCVTGASRRINFGALEDRLGGGEGPLPRHPRRIFRYVGWRVSGGLLQRDRIRPASV